MADPLVHLDLRDDGVAVLRLDHPKVNALSRELLHELHERVQELRDDLPGAVVVTGGDRIFAAGAEISQFGGPAEAAIYGGEFRQTFDALAALPRATVAAISGYALGGGCELALACDFRIASDRAKLGQPEILLGITPGGGGTQRLPRLIGPARAKQLIFTGRQVPADEALAIGLVDEVVPADEVFDRALAFAAELARGAVVAQGIAKHAIDAGLDVSLDDGQQIEQDGFVDVFATDDARIGVESFLANGPGKATFTGR
jgi:enoyl-CoA hydratase